MKKKKLNSLKLNKMSISNLKGGAQSGWSAGCTDGCGSALGATLWNCTKANCTADCDTFVCNTREFCTSCPGAAANPSPRDPANNNRRN